MLLKDALIALLVTGPCAQTDEHERKTAMAVHRKHREDSGSHEYGYGRFYGTHQRPGARYGATGQRQTTSFFIVT